MRLIGHEAIDYALEHNLRLSQVGGANNLTVQQACRIARDDPRWIFIDLPEDEPGFC